jgi:hypothetical protein
MSAAGQRLARGARRIGGRVRSAHPLALVAAVAVVAVLAVLAVRVNAPPAPYPAGAMPPRIGVSDGDRVADYEAAGRAELDGLGPDARVYALVTLVSYVPPERLPDVVAADGDVRPVIAFGRVPLPGRQTEIVRLGAQRLPDDVARAMAETATRKEREAADYARRAAAETEPERRALLTSNAEVSRAEAAGYATRCGCVYAVVVHASRAGLVRLAGHDLVRAVDPAPEVTDVSRAVFTPPLPEHVDVVGPLPDDLTSSDGASAAVRSS